MMQTAHRKHISHRLRWKVAAAQSFKCKLCGHLLGSEIDLDHIVPLSAGGTDAMSNLQVLHLHCHRTKTCFETAARNRRCTEYYCEECNQMFSRHFVHRHIHIQQQDATSQRS
jgi:hypothetical protein